MRKSIGALLALTLAALPAVLAAQTTSTPRTTNQPPYQAPTPRPSPPRPSFLPLPPPLPPPYDLTSTTDQTVCTQHAGFGGGLACEAALPQGRLAFVWNWSGVIPIVGYHVYQVTRPPKGYDTPVGQPAPAWSRTLIGAQAHGAAVTLFLGGPAASSVPTGTCFAATAFTAYRESALSRPYCIGANARIQSLTISATHVWSLDYEIGSDQDPGVSLVEKAQNSNSLLVIGWRSWPHSDEWGEGMLYFPLPNLAGKTIDAAHVNLHVDYALVGSQSSSVTEDTTSSCLTSIGVAQNEWWEDGNHDLRQAGLITNSGETGPAVSYDVTAIVRNWATGQENDGFDLLGKYDPDASKAPMDGSTCLTTYRSEDMTLVVQYH